MSKPPNLPPGPHIAKRVWLCPKCGAPILTMGAYLDGAEKRVTGICKRGCQLTELPKKQEIIYVPKHAK